MTCSFCWFISFWRLPIGILYVTVLSVALCKWLINIFKLIRCYDTILSHYYYACKCIRTPPIINKQCYHLGICGPIRLTDNILDNIILPQVPCGLNTTLSICCINYGIFQFSGGLKTELNIELLNRSPRRDYRAVCFSNHKGRANRVDTAT